MLFGMLALLIHCLDSFQRCARASGICLMDPLEGKYKESARAREEPQSLKEPNSRRL